MYVKCYNELILAINDNYNIEVTKYKELLDEKKNDSCKLFCELLKDNELFNLFTSRKVKLFSTKNDKTKNLSESLFDKNLLLKSLFNNKPEEIKNLLWEKLYNIVILYETNQDSVNNDRIDILKNFLLLKDNKLKNNVKEKILNVDVNDTTDNMLNDIVGSFQNLMSKDKNPFDNIMNITNDITSKYEDKLKNGEVELDKVISSIQTNLPKMAAGMDKTEPVEKVVIDENFSTSKVPIGEEKDKNINLSNMMNTMNTLPNMTGLMNMVQKLDKVKTDEEVDKLQEEMQDYLKKDLNIDMNEFEKKFSEVNNNVKNMND